MYFLVLICILIPVIKQFLPEIQRLVVSSRNINKYYKNIFRSVFGVMFPLNVIEHILKQVTACFLLLTTKSPGLSVSDTPKRACQQAFRNWVAVFFHLCRTLCPNAVYQKSKIEERNVCVARFNGRLVSSNGRAPVCRAGGPGFKLRPDQRSGCCFWNDICKWLDFLVFSDKDDKP